jgi:hypothetical protein
MEKLIIVLDKSYRCFILRCLNSAVWNEREESREKHRNRSWDGKRSHPLLSGRDFVKLSLTQKEMVEELKVQWKRLWQERLDDKVRAEGIAVYDYSELFVEKGTIIHATRDFKALSFREILEQHQVADAERLVPPSPQVGGWAKFIKTSITSQRKRKSTRAQLYREAEKEKQQPKKGGRGWLHL